MQRVIPKRLVRLLSALLPWEVGMMRQCLQELEKNPQVTAVELVYSIILHRIGSAAFKFTSVADDAMGKKT